MSEAAGRGDEAEQTVRRPESGGQPITPEERPADGPDGAGDERTSPSPYAENFDDWVADETAASDGQHRTAARDADE